MSGYFTLNNIVHGLQVALDIGVVWIVVYFVLKIVKNNTRTIQIFKGVLFLFIVQATAKLLGLYTVESLVDRFMDWGVVMLVIVFQPEIRSMLERIGKTNVFSRLYNLSQNEKEHLIKEVVKACTEMSKTKTGALISIERTQSLSEYIKTGTAMDSKVSSSLLRSIFQYGTPLHDGAVIIQGDKIACAAAYFPPTSKDLPTSFGARHRAAVGISELTDSITIIVSEETGNISIAQQGILTVMTPSQLHDFLILVLGGESRDTKHKEGRKKKEKVVIESEVVDAQTFVHMSPSKEAKLVKNVQEEKSQEQTDLIVAKKITYRKKRGGDA